MQSSAWSREHNKWVLCALSCYLQLLYLENGESKNITAGDQEKLAILGAGRNNVSLNEV